MEIKSVVSWLSKLTRVTGIENDLCGTKFMHITLCTHTLICEGTFLDSKEPTN